MDCNMYKNDGKTFTEPFVAGRYLGGHNEMSKATHQNQIDAIRKYLVNNVDIKVWWMDADWYAKVDKNQSGFPVGNWVPDPERLPVQV